MLSKSALAIVLSKLEGYEKPKIELEQYKTDPEIAAQIIHFAMMKGDIKGKVVVDFGAGTGILGIGALIYGAKKVFFVDVDRDALKICERNLEFVKNQLNDKKIKNKAILVNKEVKEFNEKVDVVLQNPPFGVKKEHADRVFLEQAFKIADVVYSMHKIESKKFIEEISSKNNFKITNILEFEFPIKMTYRFHTRRIYRFKIGCWRMEKMKRFIKS